MKNLRLPNNLPIGVGQAQVARIQDKWNTMELATQNFLEMGFAPCQQPDVRTFPGELTVEQLTTLDSKAFTETYVRYSSWYSYTAEKMAECKAYILQYENMLTIIEAETKKQAKMTADSGKKLSVEELKERVILNPEYQDVLQQLQFYQQSKLRLEAVEDMLARSMRVISRQVEIRRLDWEQQQGAGGFRDLRGSFGHR